jgi:hypothetical protein
MPLRNPESTGQSGALHGREARAVTSGGASVYSGQIPLAASPADAP